VPFVQEVQQLGFGNNNPFIYFLRKLKAICGSSDHNLSNKAVNALLAKHYPAIHNAYVNSIISAADLGGNGDLAENNLLFCPAIYRSSGLNISLKAYLERQAEILKKCKNSSFASEKLKAMYSNPLTCIAKIMFDAGGEHNILENSD
jgi:hypothetical protein